MKLNQTNINTEKLEAIAAQAILNLDASNRADAKRWQTAIKKAVAELESNPYWSYDAANFDFVVMSATSNTVYSVNKFCYCQSAVKNQPCRHSAMHRLLLRYCETA